MGRLAQSAQTYPFIARLLVNLGACPQCYSFARERQNVEDRFIPPNRPVWRIRKDYEKCGDCGYDFGLVDNSHLLTDSI